MVTMVTMVLRWKIPTLNERWESAPLKGALSRVRSFVLSKAMQDNQAVNQRSAGGRR